MRLSRESNMTMPLTPSLTEELWSMRLSVNSPTISPKLELVAEATPRMQFSLAPTTRTPTSKRRTAPPTIVTPSCPAVLSMPVSQDSPSGHDATGSPSPLTVWPFRSSVMSLAPITIPLFAAVLQIALELRVGGDGGAAAHTDSLCPTAAREE